MKNWTIKEAVEEINKGNQEAIDEVAKHYPLAFMAIVRNDLAGLSQLMGDKFTMNRLAKRIAADDVETEDDGATSSSTAAKETEVPSDGDLESMTTKQLMQLCDKRGIKVPHYGKNKQFYLDALQNAGDEAEAEEASDDPYEGKSAMELYKLAKKRGLKVEPKKKAAVYAEALRKADAEAEQVEDDADDDDWGDEEDVEDEAPKKDTGKGTKKAPAKSTKKAPAKKAEPVEEEDDGDDWDI